MHICSLYWKIKYNFYGLTNKTKNEEDQKMLFVTAYSTASGTLSSAANIPVTPEQVKNGVSAEVTGDGSISLIIDKIARKNRAERLC